MTQETDSRGDKIFRAGTLIYTKRGLIGLVVWLLWADVCFDIMEKLPGLIPLKLKALEAPNWLMAVRFPSRISSSLR